MNSHDILTKLNAFGSEIANVSDQVLDGMSQGEKALRSLNDLQNGIHLLIAQISDGLRTNAPELIAAEFDIQRLAKSTEIPEIAPVPQASPQAQDSRKTVTSAAEAVGGVGEGTDAGGAREGADHAAQSVQAVAESGPVEPGPAPDIKPMDRVLDLYATGEVSSYEISEQLGCDAQGLIRAARSLGDPRAARGDLRRSDRLTGLATPAVAPPAPLSPVPAPTLTPDPAPAPAPAVKAAPVAKPQPPKPAPLKRIQTVTPDEDAIGRSIAEVSIGQQSVIGPEGSTKLTGAMLRVVARLHDQRVYSVENIWKETGRYVTERIFRVNLIEIQKALEPIGLHIYEVPDVGFQLRLIAGRR